jgi:hypothetical protein
MTAVMLIVLAADSDYVGPLVMLLFALPFFGILLFTRKGWWAIIPAGVFSSIAVVSLLDILAPQERYTPLQNGIEWGVYAWVLFLGFGLTLSALLLRKNHPTAWAEVPALGFLPRHLIFIPERFQQVWLASIMIVLGAYSAGCIPVNNQSLPKLPEIHAHSALRTNPQPGV